MVTINVNVNMAGIGKERMSVVAPLLNSIRTAMVQGSRHILGDKDFAPMDAKNRALDIIRAIPEATVELCSGNPRQGGHTKLPHGQAEGALGTLLRTPKFAKDFTIQLVPEIDTGVKINGKLLSPQQVEALDIDWRVAFGHKNTKVTLLLEKAEAQVLGDVVQIKDHPDTRAKGFTKGIFSEIRTVLAEYDLPPQGDIEGWPV